MKKIILCLIIFNSILFSNDLDSLKNSIITYGTIELNVPAEYATLSFKIKSVGSTLREAVERAKTKTGEITADILKMSINENDISTSKFFSGENIGGKSFLSSKSDYKAEINTYIKIDSLFILEDIVLKISEHKPDEISDISFNIKNPENYKMLAIEEAIKKAKQKAILLANEFNVNIGQPMIIEENFSFGQNVRFHGGRLNPYNYVYEVDGVTLKDRSIYSEQIKIEASLKLIISIQ